MPTKGQTRLRTWSTAIASVSPWNATTISALRCAQPATRTLQTSSCTWLLGLVGEAGEIAEKVKKLVRDKNSDLAQLDRDDMAAELGDVLWYAAVLANFLGLSLNDVAQRNVDKLADRQRRAVLGGSGDKR